MTMIQLLLSFLYRVRANITHSTRIFPFFIFPHWLWLLPVMDERAASVRDKKMENSHLRTKLWYTKSVSVAVMMMVSHSCLRVRSHRLSVPFGVLVLMVYLIFFFDSCCCCSVSLCRIGVLYTLGKQYNCKFCCLLTLFCSSPSRFYFFRNGTHQSSMKSVVVLLIMHAYHESRRYIQVHSSRSIRMSHTRQTSLDVEMVQFNFAIFMASNLLLLVPQTEAYADEFDIFLHSSFVCSSALSNHPMPYFDLLACKYCFVNIYYVRCSRNLIDRVTNENVARNVVCGNAFPNRNDESAKKCALTNLMFTTWVCQIPDITRLRHTSYTQHSHRIAH